MNRYAGLLRQPLREVNLLIGKFVLLIGKQGEHADDFSPEGQRPSKVGDQALARVKAPPKQPCLMLSRTQSLC
jgi:hypothetical protein